MLNTRIQPLYNVFLSENAKEKSERFILSVSIISYLVHLTIIFLSNQGLIQIQSKFLTNPIAAIYTPFSFILIYEVYLLIYFLPKSISSYIGKQYEIITLIVIRRIFKDIASLELTTEWFKNKDDLQFTYDAITSLLLFILIYYFYQKVKRASEFKVKESIEIKENIKRYIQLKEVIAVILVPILIILALYTVSDWLYASFSSYQNGIVAFKNINKIFFDDFFSVLIITDVLLLLASFFYTNKFHKIIRNSGFIISTILIKISFSTNGLINNALIIGAVLFGFIMLIIHNKFENAKLTD